MEGSRRRHASAGGGRGVRECAAASVRVRARQSKTSSSLNRVHESNTGNGSGRTPRGVVDLEGNPLGIEQIADRDGDARGVDAVDALDGELLGRPRVDEVDCDLRAIIRRLDAVAVGGDLPFVHGVIVHGVLRPDADRPEEVEDDAPAWAGVDAGVELPE